MSLPFDIVIVTADEHYEGPWHTQLIYTEYLSSHTKVLFLNPPGKWKPSHLFRPGLKEKQIHTKLSLLFYQNVLPASFPLFRAFNEWYNQRLITRKLKNRGYRSVLLWQFDAFRNGFGSRRFAKTFSVKRIYHVIDPFMGNPKNALLSRLADLIVITSPRNNPHYAAYHQKLINIPQVMNVSLNKTLVAGQPRPGTDPGRAFVILLGTISPDIDFEALATIVAKPAQDLLVAGQISGMSQNDSRISTLFSKPNVHYTGLLRPAEFYPLLAKAKAGLILYTKDRKQKAFSTLKVVNYLLAGIPVISNTDCEVPQLNGSCIYSVTAPRDLQVAVERAFRGNLPFDTEGANAYLNSIDIKEAVNTILSKLRHAV